MELSAASFNVCFGSYSENDESLRPTVLVSLCNLIV